MKHVERLKYIWDRHFEGCTVTVLLEDQEKDRGIAKGDKNV